MNETKLRVSIFLCYLIEERSNKTFRGIAKIRNYYLFSFGIKDNFIFDIDSMEQHNSIYF